MFSGVLGAGGAGRGSFVPLQFDRLFGSTKAPNTDYNPRDMEAIFFHRGNPFFQNEAAASFFSSFLFLHLTTQLVETTEPDRAKNLLSSPYEHKFHYYCTEYMPPSTANTVSTRKFHTFISYFTQNSCFSSTRNTPHIQHYSVALPLLLTDDDLWLMLLGVLFGFHNK